MPLVLGVWETTGRPLPPAGSTAQAMSCSMDTGKPKLSARSGPAVIEEIEPGAVLGGAGKSESERVRPVHLRLPPRCARWAGPQTATARPGARARAKAPVPLDSYVCEECEGAFRAWRQAESYLLNFAALCSARAGDKITSVPEMSRPARGTATRTPRKNGCARKGAAWCL